MSKNRKNKRPRVMLTLAQREEARKEINRLAKNQMKQIRRDVADTLIPACIGCMALALHDEFDFGHDRVMRGVRRFLNEFNAIADGYQNFDDIKAVLAEECNIDIDGIMNWDVNQ